MSTVSRLIVAALLVVGLVVVSPAWAQEAQEEVEAVRQAEAQEEAGEDPAEEETRLWSASFFGGNMSAGNPVGTVENPFFNTTFKTGSSSMWGFRASRSSSDIIGWATSTRRMIASWEGQIRSAYPLSMRAFNVSVRCSGGTPIPGYRSIPRKQP